jgi:hypothetical protein
MLTRIGPTTLHILSDHFFSLHPLLLDRLSDISRRSILRIIVFVARRAGSFGRGRRSCLDIVVGSAAVVLVVIILQADHTGSWSSRQAMEDTRADSQVVRCKNQLLRVEFSFFLMS